MSSIHRKIRFGFYVFVAIIALFAALAYSDLRYVQGRVQTGVTVYDFIDAVIEGRRHEKNLFLFASVDELNEALAYNTRAATILQQHSEAFLALRNRAELDTLAALLRHYHDTLAGYRPLINQPPQHQAPVQDEILKLGHKMEEAAQRLQTDERRALDAALDRSLLGLLAAVLLIALLGYLAARLFSRVAVQPMTWMQQQLAAIGEGRHKQAPPPSQDEELIAMDRAIQRMGSEIEARNRQLLQAEKLASLGTLVSGIAHELNNPLSNISSSCQILLEELQQDSGADPLPWLRQIDDETERAKGIVQSVLSFSRETHFSKQYWPLAPLIDEALRLIGRLRRERIALEIAPGLSAWVDQHRLQQVLVNLLNNALDAGGPEVRIGIRAEAVAAGQWQLPEGAVSGRRPCPPTDQGELLVLEVWDDGPGIPAENLARIFDPFFTTKDEGQGYGLGLFVSHEIIDQHGGCIAVARREGGGSRFLLCLPLHEAQEAA
jgi:two-component system NtrC family sensor kinase